MKILLTVFTFLFFTLACSEKKTWSADELKSYEAEVNGWHAKRIESLRAADGWLNLVGLFWLTQGPNSFGSGEANDVIFPKGTIAEHAGYFLVRENMVSVRVNDNVGITTDGVPVHEQVIYHTDSTKAVVLAAGSLTWTVIKRNEKLGIRLRDLNSEGLKNFTGIERYPVNPEYRLEANFIPAVDSSHTISITNVLGQTNQQASPGSLTFNLNDEEFTLDVLQGNDTEYFVIFADATSAGETYGGGRFLYVKKPVTNEPIIVDFNKAYNPPCVFTSYATCPLPPAQNRLSASIRAGEKDFHLLDHPTSITKASP